jgi:diguanylate cyclase (GGDEF)-like protein
MTLLRESFEAGASDYISKPIHPVELVARIKSAQMLKAAMEIRMARERQLLTMKERLEQANRELEQLALKDGLTGVPNRRYFEQALQHEWNRARRDRIPISVVMTDIDYFKDYNDTYGHVLGDACLIAVATALKTTARRSTDLVARYGGEEFAIILPNCDYHQALAIGRRVVDAVLALEIRHSASKCSPWVTLSAGIAVTHPAPGQSPHELVEQADRALYRSKAGGRNRVTQAGSTEAKA